MIYSADAGSIGHGWPHPISKLRFQKLMLNAINPGRQVGLRFTRRDWLGAACCGTIGLPTVLANLTRPALGAVGDTPAVRRAKSVILILLTGGPSQHDTFDLKPQSPEGIRGEFHPIDTAVPGTQICEHMPLLAARARQY